MGTSVNLKRRVVAAGTAAVGVYSTSTSSYNAYIELTASTAQPVLLVGFRAVFSTNANPYFAIATGGAGAETAIWTSASVYYSLGSYFASFPTPIRVASGTRLSVYVGYSGSAGYAFYLNALYVKESSVQ